MTTGFEFCLHVGLPKTATTSIQHGVFKAQSAVNYLGKPFDPDVGEIVAEIRDKDGIACDLEACRGRLRDRVLPRCDPAKKLVLLSEECFVAPFRSADRRLVAMRLRELFGEAKILFTIRSQPDLVTSVYIEYLGHLASQRHFERWLEDDIDNALHGYLFNYKYHEVISAYAELFGRDRVKVLLFEQFRDDFTGFLADLGAFLGVSLQEAEGENEGPGKLAINTSAKGRGEREREVLRRLHRRYLELRQRHFPNARLSRFTGISASRLTKATGGLLARVGSEPKLVVPEAWRRRLERFYRDSNQRLQADFHLPLERYGYPL